MYTGVREAVPASNSSASPTHALVIDPRSPRAQLMGLPSGPAGTVATLAIMKRLANEAKTQPSQLARNQALQIYRDANLRSRDGVGEVRALQMWIQNHIRYVRDPVDVELVQTPEVTLKLRTGDCDDQATLLAAMLKSTGHPAQFVAVGINGGPFSHVLVETPVGSSGKWVAAETILRKHLGWYPPDATSRYVRTV